MKKCSAGEGKVCFQYKQRMETEASGTKRLKTEGMQHLLCETLSRFEKLQTVKEICKKESGTYWNIVR